jgi:hypothetical protein
MTRRIVRLLLPALAAVLTAGGIARAEEKAGPQVAHMVFFTLKDRSKEAREALVASCHKYLANMEGAVSFSVGTIAEDLAEPGVSVRDFDVALHVVFEDKEAERKSLVHPRHQHFVAENKGSFAKVRVFDSYLATRSR